MRNVGVCPALNLGTQPNLPHPLLAGGILATDEHCQVREALRAAERTFDKRRKERTITKQGGWGRKLSTSVSKKKVSDQRIRSRQSQGLRVFTSFLGM